MSLIGQALQVFPWDDLRYTCSLDYFEHIQPTFMLHIYVQVFIQSALFKTQFESFLGEVMLLCLRQETLLHTDLMETIREL